MYKYLALCTLVMLSITQVTAYVEKFITNVENLSGKPVYLITTALTPDMGKDSKGIVSAQLEKAFGYQISNWSSKATTFTIPGKFQLNPPIKYGGWERRLIVAVQDKNTTIFDPNDSSIGENSTLKIDRFGKATLE